MAYVREPPGPSRVHQEWVGELYLQVRAALEGKRCRAYVAPFDVRLPKSASSDDQIDTVVQPDILIVCDLRKLDARGVCGAPDWVAEVLSPSTARYDQLRGQTTLAAVPAVTIDWDRIIAGSAVTAPR